MHLKALTPQRWKQVREVAALLLDAPHGDREALLQDACAGDLELRNAALQVVRDFSTADDLFGCPSPLKTGAESSGWQPGERIGPYRLLGELGHGGMGTVYLANRDDGAFDKQVALKIIPRHGGRRMFLRERQILAGLEHPGIARLLDGGSTSDGVPYLVMEYVDGVSIGEHAATLGIDGVLRLFLRICEAIRYAHQNLVVHRDLKPANILVTRQGEPKVLDFGIAKMLESDSAPGDSEAMTQAVMTPAWASPEQLAGKPANTLSDIYSLGLVLYHLLTRTLPKPGDGIPPPSRWVPALKGDLDSIVLKALELEPSRRYSSVEQFSADIERFQKGEPVEARQGAWWYRAAKFIVRKRWFVIAGFAFAAVLALGAAGTITQRQLAERRFDDVKDLARSVMFEYQDELGRLPASTALRARIARDTVQYLDHIALDAGSNDGVLYETALAYRRVGEIQGYSRLANLGDQTGAKSNLLKSQAILDTLVARNPGNEGIRVDLAITLERLANVATNSGRNSEALSAAERSIATLSRLSLEKSRAALTGAWSELSTIHERRGQNKLAIDAARKAVEYGRGLPPGHRDEKAWAYDRLAVALVGGERVSPEAMNAAYSALALYGPKGSECGSDVPCHLSYLTALDSLAHLYYFGNRNQEGIAVNQEIERESAALAQRDPNDRMTLRLLRNAQASQGLFYQSMGRIPEALLKLRDHLRTSLRIAESDPLNPEGVCLAVYARAKYGEVLVQNTGRIAEAEAELTEALQLSNRMASDSLQCLDQRKLTAINLARVAERKGDWAGGMEWRRETVRTATKYARLTPGEPLGMTIEAGANYELGLGGLEAAKHGSRDLNLREARNALERSLAIYRELAAMGSPLRYQYDGWPERTTAVLKTVNQLIRD